MVSNRGFTLIELLVTMAVLGIISAIAAPSMSNLIAKQRLNSAARELVEVFNNARSQAALVRREITVTLNSNTSNTATNFYWSPGAGNTLSGPSTIPSIVFLPNGALKDTAANTRFSDTNFVICSAKASKTQTIILTRIGSASVGTEGTC